jgi:uncharacterized membrane protein
MRCEVLRCRRCTARGRRWRSEDREATIYEFYSFIHVLGVVMLVGNITVTSIWKLSADRTRDPTIIGFAQRLVTRTDWFFTMWGIVLLVVGGYGAAWVGGLDVVRDDWIVWSEVMFVVSGAVWLFILVPLQIRQARMARGFKAGSPIPPDYWRLCRLWIIWGLVATVPLIIATWIMLRKGW